MGWTTIETEESKVKTEARIQQDCVKWFRNNYCLRHHVPQLVMFSVPNEGFDVIEQVRKKAIGMMSGVSDTIILFPGRVVFCEFKDDIGRQKESQIDFEKKVTALGFTYWMVRTQEEFERLVLKEIAAYQAMDPLV